MHVPLRAGWRHSAVLALQLSPPVPPRLRGTLAFTDQLLPYLPPGVWEGGGKGVHAVCTSGLAATRKGPGT